MDSYCELLETEEQSPPILQKEASKLKKVVLILLTMFILFMVYKIVAKLRDAGGLLKYLHTTKLGVTINYLKNMPIWEEIELALTEVDDEAFDSIQPYVTKYALFGY